MATLGSSRTRHAFQHCAHRLVRTSHHTQSPPAIAGRRSLFIAVETTPNPDSMKFVPEGKIVLPEEFGNGLVSDQAMARRAARTYLKATFASHPTPLLAVAAPPRLPLHARAAL
jgi:hypothetical protein